MQAPGSAFSAHISIQAKERGKKRNLDSTNKFSFHIGGHLENKVICQKKNHVAISGIDI